MCEFVLMHVGTHHRPEEGEIPEAIVTESRFSARAVSALNHWDVSTVPYMVPYEQQNKTKNLNQSYKNVLPIWLWFSICTNPVLSWVT